ncbi:MAG: RNA-guided endonuclease InsQ/TnpB family protein [Dissulfuribacterales bacterium]
MKIRKAYKFRLKTNREQECLFQQFSGCCRFVWNLTWSLNEYRLDNHLPLIRYHESSWFLTLWKQSEEYGFLREAPSQALQQTLKDLDRAIRDGFDKSQPLKRMPRYRKKGQHDSFRIPQGFKLEGNRVFLPKIGWLRFYRSRKIEGTPKNITVSRRGDHWYISIQVEQELADPVHPSSSAVGIDMGVIRFATLSDGTYLEPLNSFRDLEAKLAREQHKLARKKKFSKNWHKQKSKIIRLHTRIADTRNDYLHKASTTISKNHAVVVLEDLRISNMVRSAKGTADNPGRNVRAKSGLNKSILDQGWYEFRRQLEYKQLWRGGKVIAVPPQYTSQTCPRCGLVSKDNRTSQSSFKCQRCGYTENADVVAAINIKAVGQTVLACGEDALATSVKQEPVGNREVSPLQVAI